MSNAWQQLSAQQLRKAAAIRERIDALQAELQVLLGTQPPQRAARKSSKPSAQPAPRRKFSKATRAKMAARLKERWAEVRAKGKKGL